MNTLTCKCDICGTMEQLNLMTTLPISEFLLCPGCLLNDVDTNRLNFTSFIKHISLNEARWEFSLNDEGPGVYDEDGENEFYNFALIYNIHLDDWSIYVTSSDDYWIYEELTHKFNLEEVKEAATKNKNMCDATEFFLEFLLKDIRRGNEWNSIGE